MSSVLDNYFFIPSDPFKMCDIVTLDNLDDIKDTLDCDLIEFIYPFARSGSDPSLNHIRDTYIDRQNISGGLDRYHWVMIGDDEARLVYEAQVNWRATCLFNYPYPIMGNVLLFLEHADTQQRVSLPVNMNELLSRYRVGIVREG